MVITMKFTLFVSLCLVVLIFSVNALTVKRESSPCPDECLNKPLDLSFIVDGSASIWRENFTMGLWFVSDFVNKFNIGPDQVRVSMVTYGNRVYEEDAFDFTTYTEKTALDAAIDAVPYRSGTATETGAAIRWFMENQRPHTREGVRSVVIVLTDGNSQEQEVTKEEAEKALAAGLEIVAIGVGHEVSQEELYNIASDGEHVFVVNAYNSLNDILDRLAFQTCGVKPQPVCQFSPVDISFVIDSSTSIGASNFTIELQFIKEFLQAFEINPSAARAAAVMFGDRVYEEAVINFDAYSTKKETLDAIQALKWMQGSSTNTGDGINYMTDNFLPQFRSHVAHIGIVMTDGKSQEWKKTAEAAQRARDSGITMLAVGVGKLGESLSQEELVGIAGDPSKVLTADDFAQLNNIRSGLVELACQGIQRSSAAENKE